VSPMASASSRAWARFSAVRYCAAVSSFRSSSNASWPACISRCSISSVGGAPALAVEKVCSIDETLIEIRGIIYVGRAPDGKPAGQ
jgi:hypothetical protein